MEIILTDANFKEETEKGLVLVDFWAEWCGPCRMVAPTIEEISNEVEDVKVGKLNVDENPMVAGMFGIMSIPTVILMKDGQPVSSLIGVRQKEDYISMIDSNR